MVQDGQVSARVVCTRGLFIGLGDAGIRTLRRIAKTLTELSPERLPFLRFVVPEEQFAGWRVVQPHELVAEPELGQAQQAQEQPPGQAAPPQGGVADQGQVAAMPAIPVAAAHTREEAYVAWHAQHHLVRQQLAPIAPQVLEMDLNHSAIFDQGLEMSHYLDIYIVGDLFDPVCSATVLELAQELRANLDVDFPIVITACLSVAHRNDPEVTDDVRVMGYAALRELNGELISPPLARGHVEALDHCYLLDRMVEGTMVVLLRSPELASEIMGGFLSAVVLSSLRANDRAKWLFTNRNYEHDSSGRDIGLINAIGYAGMRLPLSALTSYSSLLESSRVLSQGLLGPIQAREPHEDPANREELADRLKLRPDEIAERLTRNTNWLEPVVPALGHLRPERWTNTLRLAHETWEDETYPNRVRQIELRLRELHQEVMDAVRHRVDGRVHTLAAGWRVAEMDLETLNRLLLVWEEQIPTPEPLPNLAELDRRLRRAVGALRPSWLHVLHALFLMAVGGFLSLTVLFGWVAGLLLTVFAIVSMWRGIRFSALNARKARDNYLRQLIQLQTRQMENAVYLSAQRIYRDLRELLGVTPERQDPESEMSQLQSWRDRLRAAVQHAGPGFDPQRLLQGVPYGDWAIIRDVQELGRYYRTYTDWTLDEGTERFLDRVRLGEETPSWREIEPVRLKQIAVRFWEQEYRRVFRGQDLDVEKALAFLGRDSIEHLNRLVEHLRQRSEPLLNRVSLFGTSMRLSFLLVSNPEDSVLGHIAAELGFMPTTAIGLDYLAAVQFECNVPVNELSGLDTLRGLYNALPTDVDRARLHVIARWQQLPDL